MISVRACVEVPSLKCFLAVRVCASQCVERQCVKRHEDVHLYLHLNICTCMYMYIHANVLVSNQE